MDASVVAAMAKWPAVAAVYGWLRLDARGQWWLRDQRLEHAGMAAFFCRNYARDGQGRYYVQNGPQKVFVDLEVSPFVARRDPEGWLSWPSGERQSARAAFVTPDGQMLLELEGELALLDDRDLTALVDLALPDWDGMLSTLPSHLRLPEQSLPLSVETLPRLWRQYGVVTDPQP